MIRADFVYINGDFIYSVLRQKIVIYDKKTLEKTREIFIKNVSKIFLIIQLIDCYLSQQMELLRF